MSANLAQSMAAARRLTDLLDDPAVGGDLLLVGVSLIALVDLHHDGLAQPGSEPFPSGMPRTSVDRMSDAIQSPRLAARPGLRGHVARNALWDDRRRYESDGRWDQPCEAPMIRRAGYCGHRRGGGSFPLRDYATGDLRHVPYCSKHRDWARALHLENQREAPDSSAPRGGAPEPFANKGGDLAAHFPEIDWPKLWTGLRPDYTSPPERTTPPRPRFELVIGDDERTDDESAPVGGLQLVPAGRELKP